MADKASQGNLSDDDETDVVPTDTTPSFYGDNSSMKPRFDAMLKEIEEKLPSLDEDDSDFEVTF